MPSTITTETIQQLLEENAKLINAIQNNQDAGKLQACAAYQQNLQQNLMYLAAVADAQPQPQQQPAAAVAAQPAVPMQGAPMYQQQHQYAIAATPQPQTPYMAQQTQMPPAQPYNGTQPQAVAPVQQQQQQQQLPFSAPNPSSFVMPQPGQGLPAASSEQNK